MRKLMVCWTLFILATSCTSRSKAPCETDRFFCGPSARWEEEASRLPTERVMQLQAINWDYHRPPDDSFVHVLGIRGEEAIRVLVRHLEANPRHRTPYFYRPILLEAKFAARFDICGTSYYGLLEKVLAEGDGPRNLSERGKHDLAKYCADPLTVPWDK